MRARLCVGAPIQVHSFGGKGEIPLKRKVNHHLRVLSSQIGLLESQGYLESGQATEARRILRRMKQAFCGKRSERAKQARERQRQVVTDFVKLFTDLNDLTSNSKD